MLLIEGRVELVCTDGEVITLGSDYSGVKEGYARIGNPFFDGDPEWRFKDGDTVVGCSPRACGAMLVQDAYQELHADWQLEKDMWDQWDKEQQEIEAEQVSLAEWMATEELYELQDRLGS
jgi:hypothetical protein